MSSIHLVHNKILNDTVILESLVSMSMRLIHQQMNTLINHPSGPETENNLSYLTFASLKQEL